jgi:hypothetical protein
MRKALTAAILVGAVLPLSADVGVPPDVPYENVPYNGRYTFARVKYNPSSWGPGDYMWGLDLRWNHDYPRAETHFTKILRETTSVDANLAGNIVALDDPELFKYPIAYVCEVGYWTLSEAEVQALRAFLQKGGFLIVDDFAGRDWFNFTREMARVLPEGQLLEIDVSHPVFDAFFKVEALPAAHPYRRGAPSAYYGIFEDNDPARRLMVMVNYNNDIAEYWEFSDVGFFPIDLSNEAYKLGVNYVIYGLTR